VVAPLRALGQLIADVVGLTLAGWQQAFDPLTPGQRTVGSP
jgi:hypothetical protein